MITDADILSSSAVQARLAGQLKVASSPLLRGVLAAGTKLAAAKLRSAKIQAALALLDKVSPKAPT